MSEEQQRCVHHWRIEPADAADSQGACRLCGATRVFSNVILRRDDDWRVLNQRAPLIRRAPQLAPAVKRRP